MPVDETGYGEASVYGLRLRMDGIVMPVAVYNSVVNSGDGRVEVVKALGDRNPNISLP